MHTISIPIPTEPFDFRATVTDHGWYLLAPWRWRPDDATLERVERLPSGRVVLLHIWQDGETLQLGCAESLDAAEWDYAQTSIRRSLRIDQDFAPFYQMAQNAADQALWQVVKHGRGRLMRTPTLFEDVIKMICTTNITWSQTEQMSARICDNLGSAYPADPMRKAFPTPHQVAEASDETFTDKVRLGYRNASVQHLGREIVAGNYNLEELNQSPLRGEALRKELQKLKGVGPYAAASVAGLLGDYTYLPVDSAFREHVRNKYFDGDKKVPDAKMMSIYGGWAEWKQLAYWFDRDR